MEMKEEFLSAYTNKAGEQFHCVLTSWEDHQRADYRWFGVVAKHAIWGAQTFSVLVTKKSFPTDQSALDILKTDVMAELKVRLDQTNKDGGPRFFPEFHDGWCIT